MSDPIVVEKVLVVGMSGSGKTTAARRLSHRFGLPFHEMDTLALGPGWSTPPGFVDEVRGIVAGPRWVFDSWGYPQVRDLMWAAADTVIWLDYPRRVVLPRLLRRSLRRSLRRERIFGGNVELWRDWFTPNHPFWHAVSAFSQRRATIRELAAGRVRLVRFEKPSEFEAWLSATRPEARPTTES